MTELDGGPRCVAGCAFMRDETPTDAPSTEDAVDETDQSPDLSDLEGDVRATAYVFLVAAVVCTGGVIWRWREILACVGASVLWLITLALWKWRLRKRKEGFAVALVK